MRIASSAFVYTARGSAPERADICSQYILTRLLIGDLSVASRGHRFWQRFDYSKVTPVLTPSERVGALRQYLGECNATVDSSGFVKRSLSDNREFFHDLLMEFSEFFWFSSRGCHVAAFVFIYRALERISFSAPLTYCSIERDYAKTYKSLKEFFAEKDLGELGFLKSFVNRTQFIDGNVQEISYSVSFHRFGREAAEECVRYLKSLSPQWELGGNAASGDLLELKIKLRDIHDLFVTLRNRFLHARSGDGAKNLKISAIVDTDGFFEPLNKIFCSYVALLTLETITRKYLQ